MLVSIKNKIKNASTTIQGVFNNTGMEEEY